MLKYYLQTSLQKSEHSRKKEHSRERDGQKYWGKVKCISPPQGRETDTSEVWSDCRFNILSHPLMIHHIIFPSTHSVSLLCTHAHMHAHYRSPFLFLPLSSSFISSSRITCIFLSFLYLSLPSCSTSSSPLSVFEECHTFCFVRCYTVISNSAFFPLEQSSRYSTIWQGETEYNWHCRWLTKPKLWLESHRNLYFYTIMLVFSPFLFKSFF